MASQSDETKIAVIATELTYVKEALAEVLKKLDQMSNNYLTKNEATRLAQAEKDQATLEHNRLEAKIDDVALDVAQLKKKSWVQNTLSAVLGAVLTLLIAYFLTDISR